MLKSAAIDEAGAGEKSGSLAFSGACQECPRNAIRRRLIAREPLTLLPAILVAILPKCPLCLAAWFGVLGSAGSLSWLSSSWGLPIAAGLLSLVVGSLALRAWNNRDPRPLMLSLIGTALLLGGKYRMDAPLLVYCGLAALMAASIWSMRLKVSRPIRLLNLTSKA